MNNRKLEFKKFFKYHYRKFILLAVNIVAYALLMAWAMKVYRIEGGHGYEEMGQIVPYTLAYLVFAFLSLVVYYLSIIASAMSHMHKENKVKEQEDRIK